MQETYPCFPKPQYTTNPDKAQGKYTVYAPHNLPDNILTVEKFLPQITTRPAVVLAGRAQRGSNGSRTSPARRRKKGSRGTSSPGAVRVGPHAAQAKETARFNAREDNRPARPLWGRPVYYYREPRKASGAPGQRANRHSRSRFL